MGRRDKIAFGLTLLAVVVVPGLASAAFSDLGYDVLSNVVWASGYGLGAVMIWFVWIRPLDIHAPEGVETDEQ